MWANPAPPILYKGGALPPHSSFSLSLALQSVLSLVVLEAATGVLGASGGLLAVACSLDHVGGVSSSRVLAQ